MSTISQVADKARGKGHIQVWGNEETQTGNARLWFSVLVDAVAPPGSYGNDAFEECEPFHFTVSMTLAEGLNNQGEQKSAWIFDTLQKLVGESDLDVERIDPEHDDPYDLEGREVVILFKHKPHYRTNVVQLEGDFFFGRDRKPAKLSKFGAEFMAFRQRQLEESN